MPGEFRRKAGSVPAGPDLSEWNRIGRKVGEHNSREITAFHEGGDEPDLIDDTRSPELADAVLAEIIKLNADGRASEARALYDPAHAPFIPRLERGGRGLDYCAFLGPDDFLVLQGSRYEEQALWRIRGDQISKESPLTGFALSRNRKHFLAAHKDGSLTVHDRYGAPARETIAALPGAAFIPTDLPEKLKPHFEQPDDSGMSSHLSISDDGQVIVLCSEDRGVIVLRKTGGSWAPEVVYPSMALDLEEEVRSYSRDGERYSVSSDMMHCALSPDGRFVALGTQSYGHYLVQLDAKQGHKLYAHLGYLSEYPHDACFSSDGRFVSLNSCHYYSGVTFVSEVSAVAGKITEAYVENDLQTVINRYLRVYASGYVPPMLAGQPDGAFLLAGLGYATCVTPQGKVLWSLHFGSSAGGVDICPETGRVLIASYSGMLHLVDPARQQQPVIMEGYNMPLEVRRWLFWDDLKQPLAW